MGVGGGLRGSGSVLSWASPHPAWPKGLPWSTPPNYTSWLFKDPLLQVGPPEQPPPPTPPPLQVASVKPLYLNKLWAALDTVTEPSFQYDLSFILTCKQQIVGQVCARGQGMASQALVAVVRAFGQGMVSQAPVAMVHVRSGGQRGCRCFLRTGWRLRAHPYGGPLLQMQPPIPLRLKCQCCHNRLSLLHTGRVHTSIVLV